MMENQEPPKREPVFSNEEAWDLVAPIYHAAEGASAYKHYKGVIRPATVDEQVAVVWRGMVDG